RRAYASGSRADQRISPSPATISRPPPSTHCHRMRSGAAGVGGAPPPKAGNSAGRIVTQASLEAMLPAKAWLQDWAGGRICCATVSAVITTSSPGWISPRLTEKLLPLTAGVPREDETRTSSTAGGMVSVTVTLPVGVSAGLVTRMVQVTVSPMAATSGETNLASAGCPATGAEAGAAGPPPGSPGTAVGCTCVGSGVTVGVTPCATTMSMSLSETGEKVRPDGSLYS